MVSPEAVAPPEEMAKLGLAALAVLLAKVMVVGAVVPKSATPFAKLKPTLGTLFRVVALAAKVVLVATPCATGASLPPPQAAKAKATAPAAANLKEMEVYFMVLPLE